MPNIQITVCKEILRSHIVLKIFIPFSFHFHMIITAEGVEWEEGDCRGIYECFVNCHALIVICGNLWSHTAVW